MKKICHISTVHTFYDTRIFLKQCVSFSKNNFEVHYVTCGYQNTEAKNINVHKISSFNNRILRMIFAPFKAFIKAVKTQSDIIVLHDPELILIGFLFKITGRNVVFDFHECIALQILDKPWIKSSFLKKIVKKSYQLIEKMMIKYFDLLILAEDNYEDYFFKLYPQYKNKFIKIRNYPILNLIDNQIPKKLENSKTKVVYAGGLTKIRGIKELILACNNLSDKIELILIGSWVSIEFEESCMNSIKGEYVNYLGYLKPEEIYQYLKACDIGIALLYPIKNYLVSIPVKAFEYLAAETAMIMSDFPLWKERFKNCAIHVNPYEINSITESIKLLINDVELRKKLISNGRSLVQNEYSWESESERLIKACKDL